MKKALLIIALFTLLTQPRRAFAWNDCPRGLINDPYPGTDSNYIDTNNDGICDHSQAASVNSFASTKPTDYHLLTIVISLSILYVISFLLSKKNVIDLTTHRKIWNIFLLVSFLVCGISGILLILRLNFGLNLPGYAEILFNHVELGIAMTVIAFFHFAWHWHYFKNIFKNN